METSIHIIQSLFINGKYYLLQIIISVYKMNEPIDSVEGYIKIRYGINQTNKKKKKMM